MHRFASPMVFFFALTWAAFAHAKDVKPSIDFATEGGDAWSFTKLVEGRFTPHACAEFEPYEEGPLIEWQDPHQLMPFYTKLIALRRQSRALQSASFELVGTNQEDAVLAYVRAQNNAEQSVLVLLNFSADEKHVVLP